MTNEAVAAFGISRYRAQEGGLTIHHYSIHHLDWCGSCTNIEGEINMVYSSIVQK